MVAQPSTSKRSAQGSHSVLIGLFSNIILAVIKVIGGILGSSYALIADGVESTMDIFSSVIVLGGLKLGTIPPDEDHPYGHGKAESLAALIVSFALLTAGAGIAIESIREIHAPHHTPAAFTLIILVGVIITKEVLFRFIFSVGKAINSLSIKTEAWHHRSDALTSVAAFIGISIAVIGGKGYEQADSWAALAASAVIAFNGVRMLRRSIQEIMDYAPDPETEETIRAIAGRVAGVSAIEKCRMRKSGLNLFVDIHMEVAPQMSVFKAHGISHDVKDALLNSSLGIADVLVHIEPSKAAP